MNFPRILCFDGTKGCGKDTVINSIFDNFSHKQRLYDRMFPNDINKDIDDSHRIDATLVKREFILTKDEFGNHVKELNKLFKRKAHISNKLNKLFNHKGTRNKKSGYNKSFIKNIKELKDIEFKVLTLIQDSYFHNLIGTTISINRVYSRSLITQYLYNFLNIKKYELFLSMYENNNISSKLLTKKKFIYPYYEDAKVCIENEYYLAYMHYIEEFMIRPNILKYLIEFLHLTRNNFVNCVCGHFTSAYSIKKYHKASYISEDKKKLDGRFNELINNTTIVLLTPINDSYKYIHNILNNREERSEFRSITDKDVENDNYAIRYTIFGKAISYLRDCRNNIHPTYTSMNRKSNADEPTNLHAIVQGFSLHKYMQLLFTYNADYSRTNMIPYSYLTDIGYFMEHSFIDYYTFSQFIDSIIPVFINFNPKRRPGIDKTIDIIFNNYKGFSNENIKEETNNGSGKKKSKTNKRRSNVRKNKSSSDGNDSSK